MLISDERIQTELKLNEVQKRATAWMVERMLTEAGEMHRQKRYADVLTLQTDFDRAAFRPLLLPVQQRRLAQVAFQLVNIDAFGATETRRLFPLTPEDEKLVDRKRESLAIELAGLVKANREKRLSKAALAKAVREAYFTTADDLLSAVSAPARERWQYLAGPPISFWREDIRTELRRDRSDIDAEKQGE
jgi:hypothetical protein